MHPGLADRVDRPLLLKDGCRKAEQGQRADILAGLAAGHAAPSRRSGRAPGHRRSPSPLCPNTRLRCPRREWRRTVLQRCSRQKRSGRDPPPAPRAGGLGGPRAAGRFERLGQRVVRAAPAMLIGPGHPRHGRRPRRPGCDTGLPVRCASLRRRACPAAFRATTTRPARTPTAIALPAGRREQRPVTIARQQNSPPAKRRHVMSPAAGHPVRGEVAAAQAHHLAVAGPGLVARCCLRRRRPASPITRMRRRPACRSRAPRPRGVRQWSREHRRYVRSPAGHVYPRSGPGASHPACHGQRQKLERAMAGPCTTASRRSGAGGPR
ncbi:hypothetical protein ACVWZD_008858 [Streptomyces sp. TE3672]